jgi:hypothetical protein
LLLFRKTKEDSLFFSEEKNQKTFASGARYKIQDMAGEWRLGRRMGKRSVTHHSPAQCAEPH